MILIKQQTTFKNNLFSQTDVLTLKQRLAQILGAYLHGFLIVAIVILPTDSDFTVNMIKAGWGGIISSLYQIKKLADEYGKRRQR
jgi:hypothetical protein